MKLGDTVLYTTTEGNVWVAIVVAVHSDGTCNLAGFSPTEGLLAWLHDVKVTGALPGSEEAFGKWCSR